MPQCTATTRNGEPCTLEATGKHGLCWAHDPQNREQRRQRAAMGGRAKASKVTRELHATLEDLVKRVVDGELEPYKGAVAGQLIGVRLRLMEHERRVRHGDELEERLAALEGLAAQHKGSPRAVR